MHWNKIKDQRKQENPKSFREKRLTAKERLPDQQQISHQQ